MFKKKKARNNKLNHRLITFMNINGKIMNKRLTKSLSSTVKEYYITQKVNYCSGSGKIQCYI